MGWDTSGAALKDLSAAEYAQLSQLLDEALELPPEARSAWLASLAEREPHSATLLRQLFDSHTAHGDGFLEDRTPLLRQLAATPEADAGLVGREFGPYRVLSLLGHGGMGSVWLAERIDGLFKRQIALKLVHPALTGRAIAERFAREREILASLSHPNIAGLLDAGFAGDGQAYLALEYVRGTPLTAYCDDHRLSLRSRLELFGKVMSAVQYAHAHLVIHRDLKPSNILVSEDGEVHLLDFGIAKLLAGGEARETELTRLGGAALTPDYAAPEQLAGAPITTATDVYALGVMLYELLTGERPYRLERDSRGALEEAILRADPVAPSRAALSDGAAAARGTTAKKLARALKGDLDTITLKALKKSPRERYATVNAFAEDIGRYLSGQVVLAQPDSTLYRLAKFARRRWAAIVVAGGLILTLAGGLAATSYEARVASRQRDAALQAQLRSLTQTAAARLREGDVPAAMAMIMQVLPAQRAQRPYAPEALAVFQEGRASDAQLLALVGHTGKLRSVVFSPDGGRIATSADDGSARIWDAALGQQLLRLGGHTARVRSVAFSPDGNHIATASNDGTARIWDAATGRELMRLAGHSADVSAAAFSPDGARLVTTSLDHTARIWDAVTGRELLRLEHPDTVNWGAFAPDGRRIVTGSSDGTARIWDAVTGRELLQLTGHTDRVSSVAFSPEGGRIVTGSYDHTARLWDVVTGRQLALLRGHTALVSSVAFSPDGTRVLTASADRSARLWDAATGVELASFAGDNDQLSSAAFSPDGRRIVAACFDNTARVWDVESIHETTRFTGHAARVSSATFSPDGRRILTSSYDRTARVWDASSSQPLLVLSGHSDWVALADFSRDGSRIVTASADKTARVWDASSGRPVLLLRGDARLVAAAFSPDGRRIATASSDKTARIWDALTGQELMRLSGHTDRVEFVAYSPDGRRVVTSSYDRTARIWDATDGHPVALLSGHSDRLTAAVFSPDGARVLTASDDGTARVWDVASAREILRLRGYLRSDVHVTGAVFSPDGRRILTSASDGSARLWDAATGEQLGIVARHPDLVESAVFAADGRHVLTASDDRTARIWDAGVPSLDVQLDWADAAQFDHLSSTQRFELGLPPAAGVREWPRDRSSCDELAAAPYDSERRARGALLDRLAADVALQACAGEPQRSRNDGQWLYQHGRALMASGAYVAAKLDFERAVSKGYRAARIDLARLLTQPSARLLDLPRAVSLYEQAWQDGVITAAFALGSLYEHGVRAEDRDEYLLAPDATRSGVWYLKAETAGEPNALARLAEREERAALRAATTAEENAHLLAAFTHYAAAAELARREDWPDEAWRSWRYRRASLARLLARAGMMQDVARLYASVRAPQASPASTFWQRLAGHFRGPT